MKSYRKLKNLYFSSRKDAEFTQKLRLLLGFVPANLYIFKLAFRHSSKAPEIHTNNERLEFLGDAILDSVISDYLFRKFPLKGEGFLTEMRSKIVNRKQLGGIGEAMRLFELLEYDTGYVNVNATMLGNALEALIGAIYLDAGYERTERFINDKILRPYIDLDKLEEKDINYKSRLFEWSQKFDRKLEFKVLKEKTDGNVRIFVIGAFVDDKLRGTGEGRNKKTAQKAASKVVYEKYDVKQQMEEE